MRLLLIFIISSLIYGVSCKNNVKSLTESMGQEVIELGDPVKSLPSDLEEEPSAEVDDEDSLTTTPHQPSPATKKDVKKHTTSETRRKGKDIDKIDKMDNKQEEEEARIEKELSEIYKDTDYKDGAADLEKEDIIKPVKGKSIGRARDNFQFQPDVKNKKEVERFRTSVDEISCERSVTKKLALHDSEKKKSAAFNLNGNFIILGSVSILIGICR